jgi:anti-sigma-K factor RskA
MTEHDDIFPPEDGDDMRAAEYVLGVGDARSRAESLRRIETEPAFAARVEAWQSRFEPLNEVFDPVAPPRHAWSGIEARLFDRDRRGLLRQAWASLPLWRGLAVAGLVAAILFAALDFGRIGGSAPQLVASIAEREGELKFAARYDSERRQLTVRQTAGLAAGTAGDFELWVLTPGGAPVSLGLISPVADDRTLGDDLARLMADGATLAISREPRGGSPTGAPTGPVVALGTMQSL